MLDAKPNHPTGVRLALLCYCEVSDVLVRIVRHVRDGPADSTNVLVDSHVSLLILADVAANLHALLANLAYVPAKLRALLSDLASVSASLYFVLAILAICSANWHVAARVSNDIRQICQQSTQGEVPSTTVTLVIAVIAVTLARSQVPISA